MTSYICQLTELINWFIKWLIRTVTTHNCNKWGSRAPDIFFQTIASYNIIFTCTVNEREREVYAGGGARPGYTRVYYDSWRATSFLSRTDCYSLSLSLSLFFSLDCSIVPTDELYYVTWQRKQNIVCPSIHSTSHKCTHWLASILSHGFKHVYTFTYIYIMCMWLIDTR